MPTVNITIVTYNRLQLTRPCLDSLLPSLGPEAGITIVDNASSDGTAAYLDSLATAHPRLSIIRLRRNMGVSVAANLGWSLSDADYYLKLDNDVEILRQDWLTRLLAFADNNPEVGMIGYRLCDWHDVQPKRLPSGDVFLQSSCCNGACALIPRRVHGLCGFWNEDYGKYGYEDLDYSNRVMLQGLAVGYLDADGTVVHHGYDRAVDAGNEAIKLTARTSVGSGKKIYLLNKFLFEQRIRDLYVQRKYLPSRNGENITYSLNDAYRPLLRLQRQMLEQVQYTIDGDTVRLDLSAFTDKGAADGR